MCGRYVLTQSPAEIFSALPFETIVEVEEGFEFSPRYNISPSQNAPILLSTERGLRMELAHWGLLPEWLAGKHPLHAGFINARSETAAEKPAFRSAFRHRRCLVPATGFYEWKRLERTKQPVYLHPPEGVLFMAGLFEPREKGGNGFAILTTEANATMQPVHDRMPAILEGNTPEEWLSRPAADLLHPCSEKLLEGFLVSTEVNAPHNDSPSLINPLDK